MIWLVLSLFTRSQVSIVEFCYKVQTVVSLAVTKTRSSTWHPRPLTEKKLCFQRVNNPRLLVTWSTHNQFAHNQKHPTLIASLEFEGYRLTLRRLQDQSKILKMWQRYKSLTWVAKQLLSQIKSWATSSVRVSNIEKVSSELQQSRKNNRMKNKEGAIWYC